MLEKIQPKKKLKGREDFQQYFVAKIFQIVEFVSVAKIGVINRIMVVLLLLFAFGVCTLCF